MRLQLFAITVALLTASAGCGSSSSTGSGGTGGTTNTAGSTSTGGSGNTGGSTTGTAGTGGAGGCRSGADCDGAEFCAAYVLAPLCNGMADTTFVENCMTDADCANAGMGQICDDTLCVVPHGGAQTPLHCRPGCNTSPDCGPGFDCNPDHHCQPAACTMAVPCPPNFACENGTCAAKPCTSDADCANYCVNSVCSATLGECFPAVP